MKTKILSLSLFLLVSIVAVNAQVYVDGTSGKVGVGSGFTETTPPAKDLQVNGVVKADTFLFSDGTPLKNSGFVTTSTGEVQTDKKIVINNDLQVVNQIKVGTNSLLLSSLDPGTGLENTISTNNSGALLLQDVGGNVGIGYNNTTAVKHLLDVKGNVNFTGTLLNNGKAVFLNTYNNTESNIAADASVIASSTFAMNSSGNFEAIVDNGVNTWVSAFLSSSGDYLIINLKQKYTISEIKITQYFGTDIIGVGDVSVSSSIDKIEWEPLFTQAATPSDIDITLGTPVIAQFIKLDMQKLGLTAYGVSEVEVIGIEVLQPESALWLKQTGVHGFSDYYTTNNIYYDKGNVAIGGNLTLNGWDNNVNLWVPKTLTTNWRGTLLFSRFVVQEPMVGPDWGRGLISQNLKYNETTDLYETINGTTYPDFAAMIYENRGDIGFFTRDQTATSDVSYTKAQLNDNYRRMTITKEGDVRIKNDLYLGNTLLNASTINALTSASNLWFKDGDNISRSVGNVGIGLVPVCSEYKLQVKGKIIAEEVNVKLNSGWCDYVFAQNYKLMSLNEMELYLKTNQHLPDVPTEATVKEDGISLGEMNTILLKKIEEQMLYIIELNKRIEILEKNNRALK